MYITQESDNNRMGSDVIFDILPHSPFHNSLPYSGFDGRKVGTEVIELW